MSKPPEEKRPARSLLDEIGTDTAIFDKRAILGGVLICALLAVLALVWRLAAQTDTLKAPEEFQFSVTEHSVEDFKLTEPVRDIIKEAPEEMPEPVPMEERPDIHIATTAPREMVVAQEVVQSRQVEINTPKIDITATEVDIEDAPVEISQTSDEVQRAIPQIAAETGAPADIFKYKEPAPPERPALYTMNAAPRPGRVMSVLAKAFGEQDTPSLGKLGPANINLFGTGDFLKTMDRAGGVKAKTAVDSALHWLAVHQEPDGLWNAAKHEGAATASLADTALATLALMGGGHTTRKGEYRRHVLKALEAIMRQQKEDGLITAGNDNLYTHAICTIALCEAFGRARDERMATAAQKAIAFCEKAVNADGGWRYRPKEDASDMSVTAWFVQALKTARLANIKFDNALYSQALAYVDSCTDLGAGRDSNGVVTYQFQPGQRYESNGHPALTAAGMLIRQFTGTGVKNHILVKGAELTKREEPRWNNKDFYLWYYATYAMHNMGGEYRIWWNQRIRDVLLQHQSHDGELAGSWDPKADRWAQNAAGRVYTTALGALCLEVYYRYSEALNSFGVAPDLDELFLEQSP